MVIGQEQAKRDVIETVVMNELSKNSNNSCLLVGPTGSGKTFILIRCIFYCLLFHIFSLVKSLTSSIFEL